MEDLYPFLVSGSLPPFLREEKIIYFGMVTQNKHKNSEKRWQNNTTRKW